MVSESRRYGRVVCLSTSTTSRSCRPFVLWVAFTRLIWPCERCLDRDCQRCVGIYRFSPWLVERTAWHSQRKLMHISQTGPCLFLSAWLFWKSHRNDHRTCWRLAFGIEQQSPSRISYLLLLQHVWRQRCEEDRWRCRCLVLWKTSSDCAGRYETCRGSGFATRPDGVCETSLRTFKYVSSPSPTRESLVYDKRNSRDEKCDRQLALGNRRNTSRRVTRDKSVAEETISARGVGSQARRTNCKALEGLAWDWLRQSRRYPCPLTAWCVDMWSRSNLFHDREEQDFETNHPVYFQSRRQCLSRRSWPGRIHASNVVWGIDGRKSSAWRMGGGGLVHPDDHGLWELVRLFGQRRKRAWRVHASCDLVRICRTVVVASTHCVAQVRERMKSVRLHHRMSILRLCIALVQQKEYIQWDCVSQDSRLRKSFLRKAENLGSNHPVKFSKSMWHQCQFSGKKGPLRRIIQKREPHESRGHERSPRSKKDAPAKLCETLLKLGQRRRPIQNCQRKENSRWIPELRCTCWAKGFELWRTGNSDEIQNPYRGGNGKWWSANKCGSTGARSRSWLVRDSAITRRYAYSCIAW